MLSIDPIAGYAVCGVGSLVASLLLLPSRPQETQQRQAINAASAAFGLIALSLGQLLFTGPEPGPVAQFVMLYGPMAAMLVVALSFARLAGAEWLTLPRTLVMEGVLAAHMLLAASDGLLALGRAFSLWGLLTALLLTAACWRQLLRPRNLPEFLLGAASVVYLASWVPRYALTLAYDGPALTHHLYVPVGLHSALALVYAVMPMLMAALVLGVVNARLSERLQAKASTDELTGALIRRALREQAPAAMAQASRSGARTAVLMIDLDHFKRINDLHGHAVGDAALRHVSDVLRAHLRPDALLSRYGGEEFVALVPVADENGARSVAERLCEALRSSRFICGPRAPLPLSASIGVTLMMPGDELDTALDRADQALYRAKEGGRDRVELAA